MLGASSITYWISWFVTFAFMFAVSSVILTAALCVDFGVGGRMLNLSDPSIIFCCIFLYSLSLLAFILALSTLFSSRAGLHWSSLSKQVSSDDMLRVDMIWIVLFIDIILYTFVAWYVDNVFPGKFGIPKPWYFPLRVSLLPP
ncbi:unnamed protein product [Dibothriocephalus latus]|uniref:Uncharacterized protein n=1 Tax=Dibothriocephalus latus TaxID=60516 RepID=A0A3P7NC69_DIBLA|nr:unnamed protein product [Dibothriocephalus latus]